MFQNWTFGRKLAAGFALVVAFSLAIGAVAVHSLRSVVAAKDRVIAVHAQNLIDAEALEGDTHARVSAVRAFLLTGEDRFRTQEKQERAHFLEVLSTLRRRVRTDEGRLLLDAISRAELVHHKAAEKVLRMREDHEPATAIIRYFDQTVVPAHQKLLPTLDAFQKHERDLLDKKRRRATAIAASAVRLVILFVAAALALAAGLALFLTRTLGRQIGSAVQHVQSSSSELQVAANQQAAGAKEQASSMNEITTTIRELLVTSRQIAESAQRVTRIADEAASAATTGSTTVSEANQSLAGIKCHVDLIVMHMLELGKKSQRIGGILEVINELAEQTNILAINATIEAVGAGEAGRRFAVVGEEIRKLADRVGGSAKEIRALIEEVRAAVNTTVMATEGGSKAVDAGTHQFEEVAGAFRRIADLVGTTTEAAREIELSTKQQATAVEQVTSSVATVAQASKENEASTGQTLQTASQLADLSRDLGRLVHRQKAA